VAVLIFRWVEKTDYFYRGCPDISDISLCMKTQSLKTLNPKRWSGNTRNWAPITEVALNPTNEQKINKENAA
jgi:hypothetical protein